MQFLNRGGVRLAWDQSGSGTPILLIMGHRYSSAMWYPLQEALGGRYHLMWFDNRGTGQSQSPRRTSVGEMVADALAVLDAAGVDKAHVYGVSMGGGIALEFGRLYPERVRSLILGCTMAKTADLPPRPRWLMALVYNLPTPILKMLRSDKHKGGYGDNAPDDRIARDRAALEKDPFTRHGVLAQALAIQDYAITPEQVQAIALPALVLHGTQDLTVPYEAGKALSQMLPNARLVTFESIGHNYFVGAAERANAEVEAFIQTVEAAR